MEVSSEPVVKLTDASIMQEGTTILDSVRFDIEKGEFVTLVGVSGAGNGNQAVSCFITHHWVN